MKHYQKFEGKALIYAKHRPSYPSEYVTYLIESNCLSESSKIADIGSGTGILTKQLLDCGGTVIGVEPNDEMRAVAEERLKGYSKFISLNQTAEQTGIKSSSLDLITVGQAFHWFDAEAFKTECQRILKPFANVALVWNSRDLNSKIVIENAEICKQFCPNFNGFSGGIEETPEVYKAFFKNGKYEYCEFMNDLVFDLEGFLGRNLSASYAPKSYEVNYPLFVEALTEQFQRYADEGKIVFPNITKSYMGQV